MLRQTGPMPSSCPTAVKITGRGTQPAKWLWANEENLNCQYRCVDNDLRCPGAGEREQGIHRRRDHVRAPPNACRISRCSGGAALFVSALAAAQDHHGAIAFGTEPDQSNGVAYGFARNLPAKDPAQAEAMNACISSGGTNCIQLA